MVEGIIVCSALIFGLILLYFCNRTPSSKKEDVSPLASKIPVKNEREKAFVPSSYSAPVAPVAPMDMTVLLVATPIDTSEPERYSSPVQSYTEQSYDDSSSRSSSSSWGGDCGSSYSSSDSSSSSSSSDSCNY